MDGSSPSDDEPADGAVDDDRSSGRHATTDDAAPRPASAQQPSSARHAEPALSEPVDPYQDDPPPDAATAALSAGAADAASAEPAAADAIAGEQAPSDGFAAQSDGFDAQPDAHGAGTGVAEAVATGRAKVDSPALDPTRVDIGLSLDSTDDKGADAAEDIHAHFVGRRQKPQRYLRARGQVPPSRPLDPIRPYVAGPRPRRRRSDIPVFILALVVASIVMVTCCIAGFGLFRTYGL